MLQLSAKSLPTAAACGVPSRKSRDWRDALRLRRAQTSASSAEPPSHRVRLTAPPSSLSSKQMARVKPLWAAPFLPLIAGLVIGCSSPTHLPPPSTAKLPKPIPPTWTYDPARGIELTAEGAGNVVRVAVTNLAERDLVIGPRMFALIVEGRLYRIDSTNVTVRFPVRKLRPHEQALGTFQFHGLKSVEGAQLVLNSPDAGAQTVRIESSASRARKHTPDLPPLTRGELKRIKREQEKLRKTLLPELQKLQPQQPGPASVGK